jgi:hypothetical protein
MADRDEIEPMWRVVVEIPARLHTEYFDTLFTAIADAAHDWEERQDREGWDILVSGHMRPEIEATADDATVERVKSAMEEVAIASWSYQDGSGIEGYTDVLARAALRALHPGEA